MLGQSRDPVWLCRIERQAKGRANKEVGAFERPRVLLPNKRFEADEGDGDCTLMNDWILRGDLLQETGVLEAKHRVGVVELVESGLVTPRVVWRPSFAKDVFTREREGIAVDAYEWVEPHRPNV